MANMPQLENRVINRPKCRLNGCETLTREGGFCDGHWTEYRLSEFWAGDRRDAFVAAKNKEVRKNPVAIRRCQSRRPKKSSKCLVDNCVSNAKHRGVCSFHYERWRRHGNPNFEIWIESDQAKEERSPIRPRPQRGCKVKGCDAKHYAHGLCQCHYSRWSHKRQPMDDWIKSPAALKPRGKKQTKTAQVG